MPSYNLFISTVTKEFGSYRARLVRDLTRPNISVKVQEDFMVSGTETLDKLDAYILDSETVIHLASDMTGSMAKPEFIAWLEARYPDMTVRFSAL